MEIVKQPFTAETQCRREKTMVHPPIAHPFRGKQTDRSQPFCGCLRAGRNSLLLTSPFNAAPIAPITRTGSAPAIQAVILDE